MASIASAELIAELDRTARANAARSIRMLRRVLDLKFQRDRAVPTAEAG